MKYPMIIILILTVHTKVAGQSAQQYVDSIHTVLNSIESYTADIVIDVNVDFIDIPEKRASVSFTHPDTYDVTSEGFMLIPKAGMRPITQQLDPEKYLVVDRGYEVMNGTTCLRSNLIPQDNESNVILSSVWIDTANYTILSMETFTRAQGNYKSDFSYQDEVLPSEVIVTFDIEGMNIPLKYFGTDVELDPEIVNNADSKSGSVRVEFKNYNIEFFAGSGKHQINRSQ